ncbi:hypothetical protein ACLB2K_029961 [Fragaria x ananassa]
MWSSDVKQRSGNSIVRGCDLYRLRTNIRVLIRQEEDGIFIFQFKDRKVKDMILNGGLRYFNISMLLLAEYDGVADLIKAVAALHYLRVCVALKDFSNTGVQNRGELEVNHTRRKVAGLGRDELVLSSTVVTVKMATEACLNFFARNPNFKSGLTAENRLGPMLTRLEECGYEMTSLDLVSRPKPYSVGQMLGVFGLELNNFPLNLGEVVEVPIKD